MILNIDTEKPADRDLLKAMLPVIFPAARAAAILVPNAATSLPTIAGLLPIPTGAPDGATWVHSVGAPVLQDAAGQPIAVNWTEHGPVIAPPPAPNIDPAAEAAGQALLKAQEG